MGYQESPKYMVVGFVDNEAWFPESNRKNKWWYDTPEEAIEAAQEIMADSESELEELFVYQRMGVMGFTKKPVFFPEEME